MYGGITYGVAQKKQNLFEKFFLSEWKRTHDRKCTKIYVFLMVNFGRKLKLPELITLGRRFYTLPRHALRTLDGWYMWADGQPDLIYKINETL